MNLNALKPYFPQAFSACDLKTLIIAILIYGVVAFAAGVVAFILAFVPIIAFIANVLCWVVRVYCAVGIIISLLVFFKIVE